MHKCQLWGLILRSHAPQSDILPQYHSNTQRYRLNTELYLQTGFQMPNTQSSIPTTAQLHTCHRGVTKQLSILVSLQTAYFWCSLWKKLCWLLVQNCLQPDVLPTVHSTQDRRHSKWVVVEQLHNKIANITLLLHHVTDMQIQWIIHVHFTSS